MQKKTPQDSPQECRPYDCYNGLYSYWDARSGRHLYENAAASKEPFVRNRINDDANRRGEAQGVTSMHRLPPLSNHPLHQATVQNMSEQTQFASRFAAYGQNSTFIHATDRNVAVAPDLLMRRLSIRDNRDQTHELPFQEPNRSLAFQQSIGVQNNMPQDQAKASQALVPVTYSNDHRHPESHRSHLQGLLFENPSSKPQPGFNANIPPAGPTVHQGQRSWQYQSQFPVVGSQSPLENHKQTWRNGPNGVTIPDSELLTKDFKQVPKPRKFFSIGRVFYALWTEPGNPSNATTISGKAWSNDNYGEWHYTKARRFVVVRAESWSCIAIPITTYAGRGVGKNGVVKANHAVIYSGKVRPTPGPREVPKQTNEAPMPSIAIKINPDAGEELSPMSRIDFAKPCHFQHYVKVKSVGMVHADSVGDLIGQFMKVMGGANFFVPNTLSGLKPAMPVSSDSANGTLTKAEYQEAFNALIRAGLPVHKIRHALGIAPSGDKDAISEPDQDLEAEDLSSTETFG